MYFFVLKVGIVIRGKERIIECIRQQINTQVLGCLTTRTRSHKSIEAEFIAKYLSVIISLVCHLLPVGFITTLYVHPNIINCIVWHLLPDKNQSDAEVFPKPSQDGGGF